MMKILLFASVVGALLGGCDGAPAEPSPASAPLSPTKQAEETTTATGYGRTHEDAYQEAVAQAVSQVCGADVAKAVIGMPGGKQPTTDSKGVVGGVSFEGVVRRCRVVSEERAADGLFRVTVEARICPPADLFANRIALSLPGAAAWQAALSVGNLSPAMAHALGGACDRRMQQVVAADKAFVLLDRSSTADEAERGIAARAEARREERAKTRGVKAADFVVDLSVSKAEARATARCFTTAERTKYTCRVEIDYTLKLIDVTTGGIVASQSGEARGSATAWQEAECADKVLAQTENLLRTDVEKTLHQLMQECQHLTTHPEQ